MNRRNVRILIYIRRVHIIISISWRQFLSIIWSLQIFHDQICSAVDQFCLDNRIVDYSLAPQKKLIHALESFLESLSLQEEKSI